MNSIKKLKINTYFTSILLGCYITCVGQEISATKIKEFIPKDAIQSEIQVYEGDLNHDAFDDIILRFRIKKESIYREHFHLFLGHKNEGYQLVTKNDKFEENNVDNTVFSKVVIKNGYFSIEYTGVGNTLGSNDIITFKYSKKDKNWLLYKRKSIFVHAHLEPESIESLTTQKDFGKIIFKDYGK